MTTRTKRRSEFRRTTRCPVCAEAGCLVTGVKSAPIAVLCKHTTSAKVIGNFGFLHVLDVRGPVFAWTPAGREVDRLIRSARCAADATRQQDAQVVVAQRLRNGYVTVMQR